MSELEESLKKSVFGIGEAYKTAEKDLSEETAAASEVVNRVTDGIASLTLDKGDASPEGTSFTLYLSDENNLNTIAAFFVSSGGYPIKVASSERMIKIDVFETLLKTRADINNYYQSLASTPSSRLVLRIAFLIRQRNIKT